MWRFVLALLCVIFISSIGIGLLFDAVVAESDSPSEHHQQQALIEHSKLIISAVENGIPTNQISTWLSSLSAESQLHYTLQALRDYPLPNSLMAKVTAERVIILESNEGLSAYSLLDSETALLVTQHTTSKQFINPWLLTGGFYFIVLSLIFAFLAPFILRLYRLRNIALAFASGHLNARLPVGSLWYLKDIEQTFNHMATRLAQLMNDMRLLSGGLSHELRTPLARVRMGLDTLCDSNDPTLREDYEIRINQNLDHMEALINALLNFSRLQHTLDTTNKTAVNLSALIKEQIIKFEDPRCVLVNEPTHIAVLGNEQYLSLLLSNLLNNALKHCNNHVQVELTHQQNNCTLRISDDGKGISHEDSCKIFQPFVRLTGQTPASQRGFGIGLALVERITHWLDGTIHVRRCEQLGGACFVLTLPLPLKGSSNQK
ncbi:ATP-binding protein [Pseudoalteromonas byunsanensis]|uniref:histidine kinase n=1 Tax=Pseudoalteromonas byunsanensis TaxID=327939 RepID=A0A1S1N551_9GAMM|nr:ATP-binding protein [Pseudoalteromonas byunsanensis]OHU96247.1 hypothetical protein BIW53_06795 [Pseudoalteromonas byunsanensis]